MDYSVTAAVRLECGNCGTAFQGETYVIIDAVARPDLARDLFAGDTPALECPACSAAQTPRPPLLVYRSDEYAQLTLFYPPETLHATDEAAKNSYTEFLLDQLGPVSAEDAEQFPTISLPYELMQLVLWPYAQDEPPPDEARTITSKINSPELESILAEIAALSTAQIGRSRGATPAAQRLTILAERALELLGDHGPPSQVTALRVILATSLRGTRHSGHAVNVERAIGILGRTLKDIDRSADPVAWATVMQELGFTYTERFNIGDPLANQETSIRCLRAALEEFTPQNSPVEWGLGRTGLAKVLCERGTQSGPALIEEAIELLEEVTGTLHPADARARETWCDAQSALAGAYNVRQLGDPAVNMERVVRLYERLNEVESPDTDPEQWANTQARLAVSLLKRFRGSKRDNAVRAREHLLQALAVYEQVDDVGEMSSTYAKLALVAESLEEHDEEVRCLRTALKWRNRDFAPHLWARTTMHLGSVLIDHPECGESPDPALTRRQAVQLIADAVGAYDGIPVVRVEHGLAYWTLAGAYRRCKALDPSREAELLDSEIAALREATIRLSDHSDLLSRAGEDLGDALADRAGRASAAGDGSGTADWKSAADAYLGAVAANDALFRACLVTGSKERRLLAAGDLHQRAAYALARAGRLADAVLCLEQGRTRTFTLMLSPEQEQLRQLADAAPEVHAAYTRAAEAVLGLESRNRELRRLDPDRGAARRRAPRRPDASAREQDALEYELGGQIEAARAELESVIAQVQAVPGMESFLRDVTLDDVLRAVKPGEPLCYLAVAPHGTVCLIVRDERAPEGRLEAVWCSLGRAEARTLAAEINATTRSGGRGLPPLLTRLGRELAGSVNDALAADPAVVFIACGTLTHLPIHAATLPATGEPLVATRAVAYAPSARLLLAARHRTAREAPPVLVTASGPADKGSALLAGQEAEAIATLFDAQALGPTASRHVTADLTAALPGATHVHLACHGDYRPEDPLSSGLELADGRTTLADLLNSRPKPLESARIVTLSACETGVTDPQLPDEAIGLPTAILLGGGTGVVATAWEARDTVAVVLMIAFYRMLLGLEDKPPAPPAEALRRAQLWLRGATLPELLGLDWLPAEVRRRLTDQPASGHPPCRHPYLWAPFMLVGT